MPNEHHEPGKHLSLSKSVTWFWRLAKPGENHSPLGRGRTCHANLFVFSMGCDKLRLAGAGPSQIKKGLFKRTHILLKTKRNHGNEPKRTQETNPLRVDQAI